MNLINTTYAELYSKFYSNFTSYQIADYDWDNYIFSNNIFKRIHLERYINKNIKVLHLVCVPQPFYDLPIFGLDIVEINGKITMICADYTPMPSPTFKLNMKGNRSRPAWGEFFSNDLFLDIPKDLEDANEKISKIMTVFNNYLNVNNAGLIIVNPIHNLKRHNKYMKNQRQNTKTFKALKRHIGEELAKKFISQVLFPEMTLDTKHPINKMYSRQYQIYIKTKSIHQKAEQTWLSQQLIKGEITKKDYVKYLSIQFHIFNALSYNSFANIVKEAILKDLSNMDASPKYMNKKLRMYLKHLLRNSRTQNNGHLYVHLLALLNGGRYMSKTVPYECFHMNVLNNNLNADYEIRKKTDPSIADVKSAFKHIIKVYDDVRNPSAMDKLKDLLIAGFWPKFSVI